MRHFLSLSKLMNALLSLEHILAIHRNALPPLRTGALKENLNQAVPLEE